MHNTFEARFCTRRRRYLFNSNTRQSRQFNTSRNFRNGRYWYSNSVRLFVCPGHSRKMSKRIVSPPDSPVILAIAFTKFGLRSLTGPQILERHCAILSRCVRGLHRKRCKSYNSGPFKSEIVCPLAIAVIFISLVTWQRPDINGDKLAVFFVKLVEWMRTATSNVLSKWNVRISATSVKFPLMKCAVRQEMTCTPVKVPLSTETVKGVSWKLETTGVTHNLWKISGYATVPYRLIIFYRAMLRRARCCYGKSSVRPSVTLRYRDHIGANFQK